MRQFCVALAFAAVSLVPIAAHASPMAVAMQANTTGSTSGAFEPKIHIVEVVDESGCQGLRGGAASSGGVLLGGLLAHKLNRGAGGIRVASKAGEAIGNKIDKNARCTQAINIQNNVSR
jgi:hypothetical protein